MEDKKIEEEKSDAGAQSEKEQTRSQNKILRNLFIGIGIFLVILGLIIFGARSLSRFEYREVNFRIVKEGNLIFYNTLFPLHSPTTGKFIADYNFYIRNDPRKLEREIPFEGEVALMKNVVINSTSEFNCNGDGIIAIANLLKLENLGMQFMRDPNATCDVQKRYTFIQIEEGNESKIEQYGPACYRLTVSNCEILKVTERFMIENFVEVKERTSG
jgi:hypothetical protein